MGSKFKKKIHIVYLPFHLKNMRRNLLILVTLLILSGCTAIKVFQLFNIIKSGELSEQHFKYEFPFEYENGLIILKARVNDYRETDFVLDSGAPVCLISDSILKATGLKKILDYEAADVNSNSKKADWYIADSIKINGLEYKKTGTVNLLFENPAALCLVRNGLLGMNVIDKCIWHIDFPNKKIILASSLDSIPGIKNGIKIPISRDKAGYIFADFKFNGEKTEKLLFDLGYADGFVSVPLNFLSRNASDNIVKSYGNGTGGAFSISKDTVLTTRVKSLSVGGIDFPNAPVTANKESRFAFGNKIIQYFLLTLNVKENEMYLTPIPGEAYAYELQTCGLDFDFAGQQLAIGTLYLNGPAEREGLLLGDTILSINEEKILFKDYCDFFSHRKELLKDMDRVTLKVKRDKTQKTVVLQKEKML